MPRKVRNHTQNANLFTQPGVVAGTIIGTMEYRLGTMGFGYRAWSQVFYPASLPSSKYLEHYSRRMDSVEIDTTFHAAPPPERFAKWCDAVPDGFRFCVKAPKAVTHEVPPEHGVVPMLDFVRSARHLHHKLAVILLQYPPTFTSRELPALSRFLDRLPTDVRFAVEFRHASWIDVAPRLLSERGMALVCAEYEAAPLEPIATASFMYVRLIGVHDRYPEMNREMFDPTPRLQWWIEQLSHLRDSVHTTWVMFNNDYAGYSIATAARFRKLAGLPEPAEPIEPSQQLALFD
jgi:uncharacterized protein YecE (DUF72 family)